VDALKLDLITYLESILLINFCSIRNETKINFRKSQNGWLLGWKAEVQDPMGLVPQHIKSQESKLQLSSGKGNRHGVRTEINQSTEGERNKASPKD